MSASRRTGSVFVTVGTTQFQDLVRTVLSLEVQGELVAQGFEKLLVQYGSGSPPESGSVKGLEVEQFALKPSILPYFASSSLVISHGGSGSILEALRAGKPLIVVINRALMDDHQTELAEQLSQDNYLVSTDPDGLLATLCEGRWRALAPFPASADRNAFMEELDSHMGFS